MKNSYKLTYRIKGEDFDRERTLIGESALKRFIKDTSGVLDYYDCEYVGLVCAVRRRNRLVAPEVK